jgi:hypothetical protein
VTGFPFYPLLVDLTNDFGSIKTATVANAFSLVFFYNCSVNLLFCAKKQTHVENNKMIDCFHVVWFCCQQMYKITMLKNHFTPLRFSLHKTMKTNHFILFVKTDLFVPLFWVFV